MAYTFYSVPSNYTDGVDLDAGSYLAKGQPLAYRAAVLYQGDENDNALSGKYAQNIHPYGYRGDECFYIVPGVVKAWGLENSELAGLYNYNVDASWSVDIGFADKRYSTTPLSRGSDAPTDARYVYSTPFNVLSWQLGNAANSYSTVYIAWNGSDDDPRCYWSSSSSPVSSSSSYVSGYGVWVFIQAAGGGGAECYYGQSSSSTPPGSGGGGGACALVYLNCKKASSARGSNAYDFYIRIGKPGAAGTEYATNVPGGAGGDADDTVLWQSTYSSATEVLRVGGGEGGINGASASTCLGGTGGFVYVGGSASATTAVWDVVNTDAVWAPFAYMGQRGGQTYAAAYYASTAGNDGADESDSPLEFQLTGNFFLKRNQKSDVTGCVVWGKGTSAIYQYGTSLYYAGGGGASACSCAVYDNSYVSGSTAYKSFGWVPAACSTGHGGSGGNGFQQPTAGGKGCVFFLRPYSMAEGGSGLNSSLVEYENPVLNGSYDRGDWVVTVVNNNDFEVTCYYRATSTSWLTKTLSAGATATLVADSDLDGYTVSAYFEKPGASNVSDTVSHKLDSSSSTSWSEP